jgi:4-hydroxyphenylacetate 3-monooxygenase
MRTGADYRQALRDGRKVWVMGVGWVEDVATHPATAGVVEEYVAWYDRHSDPAWQDIVLAPPDADGVRAAWANVLPRNAAELAGMGRCFSATTFENAGNITHTPAYGHLIALGILAAAQERAVSPRQVADAAAYRAMIARTGRFLTFSAGAATIGARLHPDPRERAALRLVRETDAGVVLRGRIGMHTSPAYAEDVYVGGSSGVELGPHRVTFVVPVNAPGVTVLCRRPAVRDPSRFVAPLSARNDELDGQMWLDDVFIPWEQVFLLDVSPEPIARWLFWHQLYCWLSKAEFTLGLGLACGEAMGLLEHAPTIELLIDLIIAVQTVRSCLTASELDPQFTPEGYAYPNHNHVAAGSIAMLKARQHVTETLRILPGSSLVVAPGDTDLASPEVGPGLAESFGGGGWTALQRSALLQMAADHVSSALDGRESAFELHANGGIPAWRGRLRRSFDRYNALANAVLRQAGVAMPAVDVSFIPAAPLAPRRPLAPPGGKPPA